MVVMYHNGLNLIMRLLLTLLVLGTTAVQAAFQFNFQPINSWDGPSSKSKIFAACGVGNLPIGVGSKAQNGTADGNGGMCGDNKAGPSTFKDVYKHDGYIANEVLYLQERDKDSGIWHQVLIDYNQGFKMDIYAKMSLGSAGLGQGKSMSGGKNANHVYPIDSDNQDITGTGTGDARRVQFRMLIEDSDFSMDMLKDSWDRKPKITQNITGADMNMDLMIDMSNSSYSDMNTPAIVTHTTDVAGTAKVTIDSRTNPGSVVTGGRFRISSYADDPVNPNYEYVDAPRNFGKNMDWLSFWHGSEVSEYWQPGEPYGYGNGDGDSGKDEDKNWTE